MIPRFSPTVSFAGTLHFLLDMALARGDSNDISRFERAFAQFQGCEHALFVPSGRMALLLILRHLGYPPGSEVVVPAFTHFSIPSVIRYAGLVPVFADLDPGTYELTPETVRAVLTGRTRAMIPTHLFGRTCPMPGLLALAGERKLDVIEDCAQAFGARVGERRAGQAGQAAYFTFGITKNFTTYSGGMVTCADPGMAEAMRESLRAFQPASRSRLFKEGIVASAMAAAAWRPAFSIALAPVVRAAGPDRADLVHRLFDEPPRDLSEASVPALQWRPVPAQARAGMRQLGALDARNELRRSAGCALLDALGRRGCAGLPTAAEPGGDHVFMSFAIRREKRYSFIHRLRRFGVDTSPGYVTNCRHFAPAGDKGGPECPVAESVADRIVHLPLYPGLSRADIQRIAEGVARADCA